MEISADYSLAKLLIVRTQSLTLMDNHLDCRMGAVTVVIGTLSVNCLIIGKLTITVCNLCQNGSAEQWFCD